MVLLHIWGKWGGIGCGIRDCGVLGMGSGWTMGVRWRMEDSLIIKVYINVY